MLPVEITEFFTRYTAGFSELNPVEIAALYCAPSSVIDSTGRHYFDTNSQIAHKLADYCKGFEDAGYAGAHYSCEFSQSLGVDAWYVDLLWSIELKDGRLNYRTAYVLRRSGPTWKIHTAMVYGY